MISTIFMKIWKNTIQQRNMIAFDNMTADMLSNIKL